MNFLNPEKKPTKSTPALDSAIAQAAYELIKEYGTVSAALRNDKTGDQDIDPQNIIATGKEIDRLVGAASNAMAGKLVDEVVVKPANKTELIAEVESELLDVSKFVTDLMNGNTWPEFEARYSVEV